MKQLYALLLGMVITVNFVEVQANVASKKSKEVVKITVTAKKDKKAEPIDQEKDIYQWLRTYAEVISRVQEQAIRQVNFKEFIEQSLKAAAGNIDAHSAFLNKEAYSAIMESASGEFSGIGISIISKPPEDDALAIIDTVPGGPAEKAGLKAGDKIVEVSEAKLRGLSSDEVINKLKGPIGSTVSIKILRNKKPMEFTLTRDTIKDQHSLCYYLKDQSVYYLSLRMFSEPIAEQVRQLLEKANTGKCKGIVLDLRRNPGGILQSAVEMAGLFLKKRSLVAVTKNKRGEVVDKYYTARHPVLTSTAPIFILIDNFTASAAEILAGSLRYHAMQEGEAHQPLMVFLVGSQTFGKGSVQTVMPITNGCALKLTTQLYFLPGDECIQAKGIEPDFVIKPKIVPSDELKWVQDMYGKETSLKHHITVKEATGKEPEAKEGEEKKAAAPGANAKEKAENGPKKEPEKSFEEKQQESIMEDVQVQAAVNMINMFCLAKKAEPKKMATRKDAVALLKQHFMTDSKTVLEKIM
ncbi:PDZ domain-containing protein [Candidatus Dependentiae bacterium]|nr:PDZ domain-containing protein [Candidatus Dependentiae bacterium]